jgi:hypothetical protein
MGLEVFSIRLLSFNQSGTFQKNLRQDIRRSSLSHSLSFTANVNIVRANENP